MWITRAGGQTAGGSFVGGGQSSVVCGFVGVNGLGVSGRARGGCIGGDGARRRSSAGGAGGVWQRRCVGGGGVRQCRRWMAGGRARRRTAWLRRYLGRGCLLHLLGVPAVLVSCNRSPPQLSLGRRSTASGGRLRRPPPRGESSARVSCVAELARKGGDKW